MHLKNSQGSEPTFTAAVKGRLVLQPDGLHTHIVEHYLVISSSIKEAQGKPAGDLQEMCQIRNLQF